jgi:hypothetical protein
MFLGLQARLEGEVDSLKQREEDIITVFKCDQRWPICAYDFVFKNRIPRFTVFRVEAALTSLVIEEYFSQEALSNRAPKQMFKILT